jgi:hypothetical protein
MISKPRNSSACVQALTTTPVLNVDPNVEIAFDPADGRNIEGLCCSSRAMENNPPQRWLALRAGQTTNRSCSAQAGAAALAAVVSLT